MYSYFALSALSPTFFTDSKLKKRVFIDLGANIGDTVRYFIDDVATDTDELLRGYGAKDRKKWEIYAVEANPFFNKHLDELKEYTENLGHTIYVFKETAAWIEDKQLEFYLDLINPERNYWGSSLNKNHPDVQKSNFEKVIVNAIDISKILKYYSPNDEVIMKIDIEGTEYKLLLHLLKQDTLKLIDIIAIEFHPRLANDIPYKNLDEFFVQYLKIFDIKFIPWN